MAYRGRKSAAKLLPFPGQHLEPLEAPAHLGLEERKLWDHITTEVNINSTTAAAVLETALDAHARARQCKEQIKKDGLMVRGQKGRYAATSLVGDGTRRTATSAGRAAQVRSPR
jgi:P27 family predicted phage terminase small subunit